jgi:hypothetical protein
MVIIFVGSDTEPFTVHWDLVTVTSDFFAKSLKGECKERVGVVQPPNHEAKHFSCYVQWLYGGRFELNDEKNKFANLLSLAVFGTFIQDRYFRNAVIDVLIREFIAYQWYPTSLVPRVLAELPPSSPFRNILVDVWVCVANPAWCQQQSPDRMSASMEFWRDVAETFIRFPERKGTRPWEIDRCQYQDHIEGEAKCT